MPVVSLGPFEGESESTLLTWLSDANKELATGKVIISAGSGDVNKTSQITNNPSERKELIKAALYTFFLQDEETYPQYEGYANSGCNMVRASFSY